MALDACLLLGEESHNNSWKSHCGVPDLDRILLKPHCLVLWLVDSSDMPPQLFVVISSAGESNYISTDAPVHAWFIITKLDLLENYLCLPKWKLGGLMCLEMVMGGWPLSGPGGGHGEFLTNNRKPAILFQDGLIYIHKLWGNQVSCSLQCLMIDQKRSRGQNFYNLAKCISHI